MIQVLVVNEQTANTRLDELSRMVACYYDKHPTTDEAVEQCRRAAGSILGKAATHLSPIGKEAHLVSRQEALRLMYVQDDAQGLFSSGLGIVDRLARRGQVPANLDPAHFILTDCLER